MDVIFDKVCEDSASLWWNSLAESQHELLWIIKALLADLLVSILSQAAFWKFLALSCKQCGE
jgi:hypothetical protein